MTDTEFLATLKKQLFIQHGTNKIKCNIKLGERDWGSGCTPYCTGVRAVSETEFEYYLEFWGGGWKKENEDETLTTEKKCHILSKVLKVKRPANNKTEVVNDVVEYGSRYGLEALGYAFREMVKSGEIAFSQKDAENLWEYGGNPGEE